MPDLDQNRAPDAGAVRVLIASGHPLLAWALRRIPDDTSDLHAVAEVDTAAAAASLVFQSAPRRG